MSNAKYFAMVSSFTTTKGRLISLLMLTHEDAVLRWSPYHDDWHETAMTKEMMYDSRDPKIIEIDASNKYNFISIEMQLKWNQIVLRSSGLGREIL